jgi:hypothetical protein
MSLPNFFIFFGFFLFFSMEKIMNRRKIIIVFISSTLFRRKFNNVSKENCQIKYFPLKTMEFYSEESGRNKNNYIFPIHDFFHTKNEKN